MYNFTQHTSTLNTTLLPTFKTGRTAPADNTAPPGPGKPIEVPTPQEEEDGYATKS